MKTLKYIFVVLLLSASQARADGATLLSGYAGITFISAGIIQSETTGRSKTKDISDEDNAISSLDAESLESDANSNP